MDDIDAVLWRFGSCLDHHCSCGGYPALRLPSESHLAEVEAEAFGETVYSSESMAGGVAEGLTRRSESTRACRPHRQLQGDRDVRITPRRASRFSTLAVVRARPLNTFCPRDQTPRALS